MSRSFNVSYRFSAKDGFTAVSKKIRNSNRKMNTSFKKLSDRMRKTDNTFKKTSTSFIGGFKGMAAAAIGFFGIKEFFTVGSRFQSAMADMSAITGATGEDLAFFRNETLRLAKASATMAPEVARAFKLVASAKSELLSDPKGLSKVTEQILLLKNAAGLDLTQAANTVLESLNQFGAGADQAAKFVNILAAGSKIGASEVGETGAAIVKAGVAARLSKLSFVQLNASLQVLAKNGIKAELAGTGLKTALLALETSKIKGITPSMVGLSTALDNLAKSNLNATQLEKLFGREALSVGKILIDNRQLVKQWTREMSGTSIAQQQAATNLATFDAKMRKMGITIKDVVIKTFLRLEPIISKQITAFTEFLETIDPKQVEAFGDTLAGLVDVAVAVGTALKIPAALLKGMGIAIGELAAQIATLDFSGGTSFTDAFSVGGKLFGIFGGDEETTGSSIGAKGDSSTTDVNVNLNAPEGIIQSIQSKTIGGRNANVGVNVAAG